MATDPGPDLTSLSRQLQQLQADPVWHQFQDQLEQLQAIQARAGFWQQPDRALTIRRHRQLTDLIDRYQGLLTDWSSLTELVKTDPGQSRELVADFAARLEVLLDQVDKAETTGDPDGVDRYDDNDVIITIFAGAGGADAQDWVGLLVRMYQRWAGRNGCQIDIISQGPVETGGYKYSTFSLKKPAGRLYGRLKAEAGVHRLVRKSPFNSRNLRQTSFGRVEVLPLLGPTETVKLDPAQLRYDFFKSSGAGGQSVNKTDSAVRLTHLPTQTTVVIQNERSQIQNKQTALAVLAGRLQARLEAERLSDLADLTGPAPPNQWGQQIRNYVFDPYQLVKDVRSQQQTSNIKAVLDGQLDQFLVD